MQIHVLRDVLEPRDGTRKNSQVSGESMLNVCREWELVGQTIYCTFLLGV